MRVIHLSIILLIVLCSSAYAQELTLNKKKDILLSFPTVIPIEGYEPEVLSDDKPITTEKITASKTQKNKTRQILIPFESVSPPQRVDADSAQVVLPLSVSISSFAITLIFLAFFSKKRKQSSQTQTSVVVHASVPSIEIVSQPYRPTFSQGVIYGKILANLQIQRSTRGNSYSSLYHISHQLDVLNHRLGSFYLSRVHILLLNPKNI